MKPTAKLVITRGERGKPSFEQSYEVDFAPGESVLDALRRIHSGQDATLAFRYSCINANACKECMLLLDGEVVYACTARLEPREMELKPLPNKPLVRDLVTEIAAPDERIGRFFPSKAPNARN
jgi:succinate dehydrogenase/fumarate reductase-like Fe-S protein